MLNIELFVKMNIETGEGTEDNPPLSPVLTCGEFLELFT